jgi:hypothetical protein
VLWLPEHGFWYAHFDPVNSSITLEEGTAPCLPQPTARDDFGLVCAVEKYPDLGRFSQAINYRGSAKTESE